MDSAKKIIMPMALFVLFTMMIKMLFMFAEPLVVTKIVLGSASSEYPQHMTCPTEDTYADEILTALRFVFIAVLSAGMYRYCFRTLDGEKCRAKDILFFFTGIRYIIFSAVVYFVSDVDILGAFAEELITRPLERGALAVIVYAITIGWLILLIIYAAYMLIGLFLRLCVYIYSARYEKGLLFALKNTFVYAVRCDKALVIAVINAIAAVEKVNFGNKISDPMANIAFGALADFFVITADILLSHSIINEMKQREEAASAMKAGVLIG